MSNEISWFWAIRSTSTFSLLKVPTKSAFTHKNLLRHHKMGVSKWYLQLKLRSYQQRSSLTTGLTRTVTEDLWTSVPILGGDTEYCVLPTPFCWCSVLPVDSCCWGAQSNLQQINTVTLKSLRHSLRRTDLCHHYQTPNDG